MKNWWTLLDSEWENLTSLVNRYHPKGKFSRAARAPITAPRAEQACALIRNKIAKEPDFDPVAEMINARLRRDWQKIYNILNGTWFGMPESIEMHSEPGFYALCDLCSDCPEDEDEQA